MLRSDDSEDDVPADQHEYVAWAAISPSITRGAVSSRSTLLLKNRYGLGVRIFDGADVGLSQGATRCSEAPSWSGRWRHAQ